MARRVRSERMRKKKTLGCGMREEWMDRRHADRQDTWYRSHRQCRQRGVVTALFGATWMGYSLRVD